MPDSLAERIAVVETKVGALETMGPKIDEIYDYVVADRANRKLRNHFFGGLAGFVAVCGTLFEVFSKK